MEQYLFDIFSKQLSLLPNYTVERIGFTQGYTLKSNGIDFQKEGFDEGLLKYFMSLCGNIFDSNGLKQEKLALLNDTNRIQLADTLKKIYKMYNDKTVLLNRQYFSEKDANLALQGKYVGIFNSIVNEDENFLKDFFEIESLPNFSADLPKVLLNNFKKQQKSAILKTLYFETIACLPIETQQNIESKIIEIKNQEEEGEKEINIEHGGVNLTLDLGLRRVTHINGEKVINQDTKQLLNENSLEKHKIIFDKIIVPKLKEEFLKKQDEDFNIFLNILEKYSPNDIDKAKNLYKSLSSNLFNDVNNTRQLQNDFISLKSLVSNFTKSHREELGVSQGEYIFNPILFNSDSFVEYQKQILPGQLNSIYIKNYFEKSEQERAIIPNLKKQQLLPILSKNEFNEENIAQINDYFSSLIKASILLNEDDIDFIHKSLLPIISRTNKKKSGISNNTVAKLVQNVISVLPVPNGTNVPSDCYSSYRGSAFAYLLDRISEYLDKNKENILTRLYRGILVPHNMAVDVSKKIFMSGSISQPIIREELNYYNTKKRQISFGDNNSDGIVSATSCDISNIMGYINCRGGDDDGLIIFLNNTNSTKKITGFASGYPNRDAKLDQREINLSDTTSEDIAFIYNMKYKEIYVNPNFTGAFLLDGKPVKKEQLQEEISKINTLSFMRGDECISRIIEAAEENEKNIMSRISILNREQILAQQLKTSEIKDILGSDRKVGVETETSRQEQQKQTPETILRDKNRILTRAESLEYRRKVLGIFPTKRRIPVKGRIPTFVLKFRERQKNQSKIGQSRAIDKATN